MRSTLAPHHGQETLAAEVSTSRVVKGGIVLKIITLEQPNTPYNGNMNHVEITDYEIVRSFFEDGNLYRSIDDRLFILTRYFVSTDHV